MAVGPGRTPDVFAPAAWEQLLDMARGVFAREWREPAVAEIDPDPPLPARLAEIAAPALVISGQADVPDIRKVSHMVANGIPGARAVELADTGHLPPVERPSEINAILRAHLATLTR
jgi:pimeloyl-ACP methyl ester carboxylesterase